MEQKLRVRVVLDTIKGVGRRVFLKWVPKYSLPTDCKGVFPSSLNQILGCSQIGLLTEELLLKRVTLDTLLENLSSEEITKIQKSKTTKDYLDKIEKTKKLLRKSLVDYNGRGVPQITCGKVLSSDLVEGHPDGVCGNSVIEVKTSSRLEKDIEYFVLQLLCYASLGDFTHAVLVLPLQQEIISFNLYGWEHRTDFRKMLVEKAHSIKSKVLIDPMDIFHAKIIIQKYLIGSHSHKKKTLYETVNCLPSEIPHQIFVGGNRSSIVKVDDEDIIQTFNRIKSTNLRVYIHSPYIINPSSQVEGDWNIDCLKKVLDVGVRMGSKGVVIHVGKHTNLSYEKGIVNMTAFILQALEYATEETPLLLETPAGEGTETLTCMNDFLDYVDSFKSPKLGICVDTCHVFACGHDPIKYIVEAHKRGNLRLVHFNDSEGEKGCCADHHAMIGCGKIGMDLILAMAHFCHVKKIDMVRE